MKKDQNNKQTKKEKYEAAKTNRIWLLSCIAIFFIATFGISFYYLITWNLGGLFSNLGLVIIVIFSLMQIQKLLNMFYKNNFHFKK